MDNDKRRSKGRFLNLFDWNGNSRKKLLYNDSDLPEASKKVKENLESLTKSQHYRVEVGEPEATSSNLASSDYNCSSSVNSDEGSRPRAPGVVARLMGLDSLPASIAPEPSSTSFYNSSSFRAYQYERDNLDISDYGPVNYIKLPFKLEKASWNAKDSTKAQRVQDWPIQRFQTEILPPKSAKFIPVTHHKLLSPIKSHPLFPPENAAYIMEAAAKIIEASPRAYIGNKMSVVGLSSVSLRIRDLKDKLESAHCASVHERSRETGPINHVKRNIGNKNNNISKHISASKPSRESMKSTTENLRSKGRSVSLAIQAKANVQSRDTPTPGGKRGYVNQQDLNETRPNHFSRSQPISQQKAHQRNSTNKTSNVLRQNNQKQNSVTNKGKLISGYPTRKTQSIDCAILPNKTANKALMNSIGSKNSRIASTGSHKGSSSSSKMRSISHKKKCVSGDILTKETVPDNASHSHDERSIKCNIAIDGSKDLSADSVTSSTDIVSFTFTSPLRRPVPDLESLTQGMGMDNSFSINSFDHSERPFSKNLLSSPPELHELDGDSLSRLLDEKLQELTCKIKSPPSNLIRYGTSLGSASPMQDSPQSMKGTISREETQSSPLQMQKVKLGSPSDYSCSSSDNMEFNVNHLQQGLGMKEEHSYSSTNSEAGKELDHRHPYGIDNYLDSEDGLYGRMVYTFDAEVELSESSMSTCTGNVDSKQLSKLSSWSDFKESRNWELEYVKGVINIAELNPDGSVLSDMNQVMDPDIFDLMENQGNAMESYGEDDSKLGRKVLFDGMSECLELRYCRTFVGSCKAWRRWATLVHRKDLLAVELYKEMLGWKSMGEMMVDELVDMDMSTQCGRWLDFDIEASEEGMEIEQGILTTLVDEFVSDLRLP